MVDDQTRTGPTPNIGVATWLAALLSGVAIACCWWVAPSWSASAAALLDGVGGASGPEALLGRALAKGASPARLQLIWAMVAAGNGAGLVILARLAGAGRLAWLAAALALWISADTFLVIGIEGPLLLVTLATLGAGHLAPRIAGLAAPLLASALLFAALLAPFGLLAVAPLAVIAALFPRPSLASPAGVASRPVAIAWLAGVLGALALLRIALPGDAALAWWNASISALRVPTPRLLLGGLSEWKGVGGLLAELALLPAIPLLLALWGLRARDQERSAASAPRSGALAAAAVWWLILGLTAETSVVDAVAIISPLVLVAALVEARRWLRITRAHRGRLLAGALGVALLFGAVSDRASGGDPRSALGRALIGLDDPTALQPAVLHPEELALLHRVDAPARIYADRAGTRRLVAALRKIKVVRGGVREWDAFAARFVLIHEPAVGPIARGWKASLPTVACTARACLLAMSDAKPTPGVNLKP